MVSDSETGGRSVLYTENLNRQTGTAEFKFLGRARAPHTQSLATIKQVLGNLEQPARVGHQRSACRVMAGPASYRPPLVAADPVQLWPPRLFPKCTLPPTQVQAQPKRTHILHRRLRYHGCRGLDFVERAMERTRRAQGCAWEG